MLCSPNTLYNFGAHNEGLTDLAPNFQLLLVLYKQLKIDLNP